MSVLILVPAELKDEEEKELEKRYVDEVMFKPEVWKRSHFVLINLLVNVTNVFLIEFSFTDTFGVQFFTIFFLLKVVQIILEMQIETALESISASVSGVLAASVGVAPSVQTISQISRSASSSKQSWVWLNTCTWMHSLHTCSCASRKISYVVNFVLDLLPFKFGDDDDEIESESRC